MIAQTNTGDIVNVSQAEKDEEYYCIFCNMPMVLRKGYIRRAHFAHKQLSSNCSPKTALHDIFKQMLYENIKLSLAQKTPVKMKWQCYTCGNIHTGNLLKKSSKVELEYNLGTCPPDIALLDASNRVVAVIEVIAPHEREKSTLVYYRQNKIAVIRYQLKSDRDLDRLKTNVLKPDMVDACTNNPFFAQQAATF